jgi:uncharacterized membrane protein YqiK
MLAFVAAFFLIVIIVVGTLAFLAWVFWQYRQAEKYRYLIRLHNAIPKEELTSAYAHTSKAPRFKITYKNGKKEETVIIEGKKTEGEALSEFMKSAQLANSKIVNLVKL